MDSKKPLHLLLWDENKAIALACLNHKFTMGLADGTLALDSFRRYIAQDAFFLSAFRKAYALAIAKCDDLDKAKIFHKLMGGVLEELNLHKLYSVKLGIELENVEPLSACRAYTDFLLRVAWQNDVSEIVAAMAPCMILYAFIGRELAMKFNPKTQYIDWIKTYASKEIQELAREMENLLDTVCDGRKEISDNYRYAMKLEFEFFDENLRTL